MKLVDILARELDRWVYWGDKIVQDDDGYIVAFEHEAELKCVDGDWKGPSCDPICVLDLAEDHKTSIVTRAEWRAAVDALNQSELDAVLAKNEQLAAARAERIPSWNGEGLPPVGSASCEYLGAHKYDEWTVVNIFAHYGHTVFVDFGDGWRAEDDSSRFRPIRTAEQVAAEEREKEIADMMEVTSDGITCMDRDDALALYKAGYRKQVAK